MTVEAAHRHFLRTIGIGIGMLAVATLGLTACGESSPSASPTTAVTTATVVSTATLTQDTTATQDATITQDATVTQTDDVTPTAGPSSRQTSAGGSGAGSTPTGGDDQSGSAPNSCPDPSTLGAVTPNYDPKYPINSVNCAQDWAVGTYEADGKNQTTGIWRETSGTWAYQDRATVCAQADNLPSELYSQACSGS